MQDNRNRATVNHNFPAIDDLFVLIRVRRSRKHRKSRGYNEWDCNDTSSRFGFHSCPVPGLVFRMKSWFVDKFTR